MKKGCFIKLVFFLTILIAVILYLVKNEFENVFLDPGKQLLRSLLDDTWENELKFVADNAEKDSLKSLINYYIDNLESASQLTEASVENLEDILDSAIDDSLISKNELVQLKKCILGLNNEK
ncbi:MAG: hypothetical protein ACW98D_21490 [Promethearchaeota archaeon]|jgi:flagellar hook-associated protein FlgK